MSRSRHPRPTSRELGQHFLSDARRAQAIVADAGTQHPCTDRLVLEIGPGGGALTRPLLDAGYRVLAVERDGRLARALRLDPRLQVVHADARDHPLPMQPFVVVANLPFAATTAVLRRLCGALEAGFSGATLLVEAAYARKRVGRWGGSLLTAQWSPWVTFTLGPTVSRHAFRPRPRVDAAVLHIHPRTDPLVAPAQRDDYQRFTRAAFEGRGDTVRRALTHAEPQLRQRLRRAPVPLERRAKDLSAHDWARLWTWCR